MTTRLPGRSRPASPPRDGFTLTAPRPARCPTGKPRFQTMQTAMAHHRVSRGGSAVAACERCNGWHHVRAVR